MSMRIDPEMVPLNPSMSSTESGGGHDERSDYDNTMSMDAWRQRLLRYQHYASIAAHISSLASVMVVIIWIKHLGGLSWQHEASKQVFNWHPLMMIAAFAFMTVASLSFRNLNRPKSKMIHGLSWSVALLSMVVGILAVFRSHNDPTAPIANLYSLHSWVGMLVLTLYSLQFVSGMTAFGFPKTWTWNGVALASESFKARLLLIHRFWGPMIYFAMMCTILLGIQEKEGFVGCAYTVDKADLFPPSHFFDIPWVCRVSHLMGLLVFFTAICTAFALHTIDSGNHHQN